MSPLNFAALAAIPATTSSTWASSLRVYVTPAMRERRQRPERADGFAAQQAKTAPHQNQVRVVGHVRTGRAEVNEWLGRGRCVAERMDVRHDVVAETPLIRRDRVEVDVVE